jgi:hypothetical protein
MKINVNYSILNLYKNKSKSIKEELTWLITEALLEKED